MDDTNLDGRPDKLETHQRGRLMYVDPDLAEAGRPTRRVVYGTGGNVERMERDADGDGQFLPDPPAGGVR